MKAKWFEGIVSQLDFTSESKMTFRITVQDDNPFSFQPGQFITMDLPLGEKRRQRWRSYSIANIPNDKNELEFGIGHLTEGLASEYFFNQLRLGDIIKFKGPEGAFVLPDNLNRPVVMIATGTGVVPFVSMIRHVVFNNTKFKHLHLIYGTRFEADILYRKELEEYVSKFDNLEIDIVLSRESEWSGLHGYVHDVYNNAYPEKQEDTLFLLCGWSSMIDEAMANLFPKVVSPPKQIKYELYG